MASSGAALVAWREASDSGEGKDATTLPGAPPEPGGAVGAQGGGGEQGGAAPAGPRAGAGGRVRAPGPPRRGGGVTTAVSANGAATVGWLTPPFENGPRGGVAVSDRLPGGDFGAPH